MKYFNLFDKIALNPGYSTHILICIVRHFPGSRHFVSGSEPFP